MSKIFKCLYILFTFFQITFGSYLLANSYLLYKQAKYDYLCSSSIINMYRCRFNKAPLQHNKDLQHSAEMTILTIQGDWSHNGFPHRVNVYYNGKFVGENLARNFENEYQVLEAWMNSPAHQDVLLSEKACEYGFAHLSGHYVLHVGCK